MLPAKFGSIWPSRFRGEDQNVKSLRRTDGRQTPSDDKSSHGLWPGELKIQQNDFIILNTFEIQYPKNIKIPYLW